MVAGLGKDWALKTISLRPWPAASSIQSVVTAVLALAETHDLHPDQVDRIEVGLSKTVYDMHGALPWDNKFRAQLSTPYVTGVALHDRRCWFEQFLPERLQDPALGAFIRDHIQVVADGSVEDTGAVVTVHTSDSRTLEDRRAYPRGDAADPLSRAEIFAKLRDAADGVLKLDAAGQTIDMLVDLANLSEMGELCSVLSRVVPAAARGS